MAVEEKESSEVVVQSSGLVVQTVEVVELLKGVEVVELLELLLEVAEGVELENFVE